MKRHIILKKRILAAMMLVLLAAAPLQVFAASPISKKILSATEQTTNPIIEFEPGTDATVVDPDDPSKKFEGDETGNTKPPTQSGNLLLSVQPSFNFGLNNDLAEKKSQYIAQIPIRPFVQVSDLTGRGGGWSLLVKASSFTTDEDGKTVTSLPNAEIHLINGSLNTSNQNFKNDTEKQPTLKDNIVIICDNKVKDGVPVMDAAPEQGMGTWVARWYPEKDGVYDSSVAKNDKVYLEVPYKNITTGTHTTVLTWILSEGP